MKEQQPRIHKPQGMSRLDIQVEIMRAAGLEDSEISKLARLKQRVTSGEVNEVTIEQKRLEFARYLAGEGRIKR